MSRQNTERLQAALTTILIIVFAIIAIGTALIPALLAYLYYWQWLLVYPVILAVIVIKAMSGRKNDL